MAEPFLARRPKPWGHPRKDAEPISEPIELYDPAEMIGVEEGSIEALIAEVPNKRLRMFLVAYQAVGTYEGAQKAVGMTPDYWRRALGKYGGKLVPEFAEAFQAVDLGVNDALEAAVQDVAFSRGIVKRKYDGDGKLMNFEVREDSALIRMVAMAKLRDRGYGEDGRKSLDVTINIVRTEAALPPGAEVPALEAPVEEADFTVEDD